MSSDVDLFISANSAVVMTNEQTILDKGFTRYNSVADLSENAYSNKKIFVTDEEFAGYGEEGASLKDASLFAINYLDQKSDNGFFALIESSHIDKHCHKNDINKTYDVVVRFNQAIARFMEFAFYHPDTFVLITSDHETGGLAPDENGNLAYSTEDHSAEDVPVFAWGYGADAIDGKTVENIEIAKLFASLMGVENFGDQSDEWKNIIYGTEE
jgi:alkaline phosphatase